LLSSLSEQQALLAAAIGAAASPEGDLHILEAGCGQEWPIRIPGVHLRITGVDLDADALRMRQEQQGDLDEAIVGDLLSCELPANSFDVAYCSFVLEHIAGAERVLDRLVGAVRPGGRIVVLVPNGRSVYGFASKHAPLRAAILYKRYVEGRKDAGKPGHAPYPTVYDPVVTLDGMRDYAARNGLTVIEEYGIDYVLRHFASLGPVVSQAMRAVARASRGRLTASHNNLGFVLQLPA